MENQNSQYLQLGVDHLDHIIAMDQAERLRHLYLIGKTGTGKSTLLFNMIAQDLAENKGLCLIDPHGDLAENIISMLPTWRADHLVYIDPSNDERAVGFNPLANINLKQRPLVADGIVSAFKHIWPDSWGPRLEHILINTVRALLDVPGASLLWLPRFLTDKNFRSAKMVFCTDPQIKAFFDYEFDAWPARDRETYIAPVLNKVEQALIHPALRNMFAQTKSTFDIRRMMDEGRVLVVNLSSGKLGEAAAHFLGALLVTNIAQAAMSRADMVEEQRRPFYFYVDEFQNFTTNSFNQILSEARKYRVSLTLANQFLQQLPQDLQASVFGNVGSLISFRVGADDAEIIARELGFGYQSNLHLNDLPNFQTWCSLLVDGQPHQARPFETFPQDPPLHNRASKIIQHSHIRFGREHHKIEKQISRFFARDSFCV